MIRINCEEGKNDRDHVAVTGDVMNIVDRIKEIDRDYFVMFNVRTQKYEVHVKGQLFSLGCELPFDSLDARAVEYVRERHVSRMSEILAQMEREEQMRDRAQQAKMREIHDRAFDGFKYLANKVTDEFPDELIEDLKDDAERDM